MIFRVAFPRSQFTGIGLSAWIIIFGSQFISAGIARSCLNTSNGLLR